MVEWITSDAPVGYAEAVQFMEDRVEDILAGKAPECIWLLEHPALYTAGTSARPSDLLKTDLPVHQTRRGGQFTYHGPGQRVVYIMLDLNRRGRDVRKLVDALEDWIIATLQSFQVAAERRDGRVGVWVTRPEKQPMADGTVAEEKIAAMGIRLRRWVSYHGVSINVEPDLSHYSGIVPCGIAEHGVTSLVDLGLPVTMEDLDIALMTSFADVFGDA